uniref:sn-1-specific diacylglycerol lipase n=1 Tax=Geotrypetes seraphini TaxID=260995 RepID=A0A6P8SU90_GEOSA|nr:sn1-specific diacylglycerol lipase beta isoform X2 [Geotrypetes seraphini]
MPGLVMFGRRWAIAGDDLVFPGAFELFLRLAWWIGILVLYLEHKGHFECPGGGLLRVYLIGLIVLLAAIICSVSAIVYISMQGTISNPGPRQSIPKLIYVRLVLYVPEFIWATLGANWISDNGVHCDRTVVSVVMGTVVISWIIIFFTAIALVIVFDPLGKKKVSNFPVSEVHDLESSQSKQVMYNVKSAATNVWENRIKRLCCCIGCDDDNRAAFSSIAELFSSYFSDTDLVPSDIAAGLTLLREQDRVDLCRDPEEVVYLTPSPPASDDLDAELEKATHYMQFAAAAYGWPFYIFSNPLTGLCKLCGNSCRNRTSESDIVGGDCLNCHFGSILQTTGLQYRDFIHISFHNKDVLTDLSADCETLTIEEVQGDCFAHKGISQAASYIYGRLVNDGLLNQAFTIAPEYKLVIVGHSLGAGAASILAILLKNSFPTLRCYAFSPPGGLLSKCLADYSKDFIVTVIVGKDLVPRLSMPNMEDLKNRILRLIVNCNKPKYQILLRGCWYEVFGGSPDDFSRELDSQNQAALSQPLLAEACLTQSPSTYNTLFDVSPSYSPSRYPLLYLPGRIIHIVEESRTGRFWFPDVTYSAKWSKETKFSSILISSKMITDHIPDAVQKALRNLFQDKEQCISCQTPQSSPSAINIH